MRVLYRWFSGDAWRTRPRIVMRWLLERTKSCMHMRPAFLDELSRCGGTGAQPTPSSWSVSVLPILLITSGWALRTRMNHTIATTIETTNT